MLEQRSAARRTRKLFSAKQINFFKKTTLQRQLLISISLPHDPAPLPPSPLPLTVMIYGLNWLQIL